MSEVVTSGAARRFTWDDFVALGEDDPRELIDGELTEVEVPTELHEHVVALLVYFLTAWARPRGAGRVYSSGYRVRISERRGVMPDVQFFTTENARGLPQEGLVAGRPDLAVEVVSDSSRRYDRVTKLSWYAAIGVPEYWIVDPTSRTLERLLLRDGQYVIADALEGDAAFAPSSFEGLEIPLGELWTSPG
jgi:Uma2 family endonuclease